MVLVLCEVTSSPSLTSRGFLFPCFGICRVFVLPCLQSKGLARLSFPLPPAFLPSFSFGTQEVAKSAMILIKCFLWRNNRVFGGWNEGSRPYHKGKRQIFIKEQKKSVAAYNLFDFPHPISLLRWGLLEFSVEILDAILSTNIMISFVFPEQGYSEILWF